MNATSTQTEMKTGRLNRAWHAMVGHWPVGLTGKDERKSFLVTSGATVYLVPREKPCPEIERNGYVYVRLHPNNEEVLEVPSDIIEWEESKPKTAQS